MSAAFAATNLPTSHPLAQVNREPILASPIDRLCDALVDRLTIRLQPSVKLAHFPNKPEEFDFEGYEAAALVLYDGSRFERDGLRGQQGIPEIVKIVIVLLVRELRGPTGAYGLCHTIRQSLHGISLAGATGLTPVETALEREAEGVYQYRLEFEGRLIAVPAPVSREMPLLHSTPPTQP
jgi:Gp37 protein